MNDYPQTEQPQDAPQGGETPKSAGQQGMVNPIYDSREAREQWREQRREWREERRRNRASGYGGWIAGAVLIVIGIVLLMSNLGIYDLRNWWALFILLPAFGALANAWSAYQNAGGRLNAQARGSLIGGMFLLVLTGVFLFGLSSGLVWPVILIGVGLVILLNAFLPG